MNIILNYLSYSLIFTGALAILIGLIGVFRMPDFFTRLHAASIVDTMGTLFILIGLMFYSGFNLVSVKLFLILIFILVTTATAAHALAKSALHGGMKPAIKSDET